MIANKIQKYVILVLLLIIGCNNNSSSNLDTPTKGDITVITDNSFYNVIKAEVETFTSLYRDAKIRLISKPENLALEQFLNDSSRVLFFSRELNNDEIKFLEQRGFGYKVYKIAIDAIAIIVNKENKDTLLMFDDIKDILANKITNWKSINKHGMNSEIIPIFDDANSCTVRYFKEIFNLKTINNAYAAKGPEDLIQKVKENKNSIGFIGVNWISDKDNPEALRFLKDVTVAEIMPADTTKNVEFDYYKPYQAYIALKYYPFRRYIYAIKKEPYNGLGHGLISFILSQPGQNIIKKEGLLPTRAALRIVQVTNENINIVK